MSIKAEARTVYSCESYGDSTAAYLEVNLGLNRPLDEEDKKLIYKHSEQMLKELLARSVALDIPLPIASSPQVFKCSECDGTGWIDSHVQCNSCRGTGKRV